MKLEVYKDYSELSKAAADLIAAVIKNKPNALICVASGHTPAGTFKFLREHINSGLDIDKTIFVSLDEWLGIDPDDAGSCISMLRKDFFDHVTAKIELFDVRKDAQSECDRMNKLIDNGGGLDVMLVGIGMNGHIGMNEPGTPFDRYAHISDLAEATKTIGQKYFTKPTTLSKGITLGLRHFSECRLPILMANGSKKADIIKEVIESKVTERLPASIIHRIPQSLVMIDAEAASKLPQSL